MRRRRYELRAELYSRVLSNVEESVKTEVRRATQDKNKIAVLPYNKMLFKVYRAYHKNQKNFRRVVTLRLWKLNKDERL